MIYITGDTHSDFRRFGKSIFPEQKEMTKKDYCIIAGDFGGVWYGVNDKTHRKAEDYNLDELNNRSFTTLFVPHTVPQGSHTLSGICAARAIMLHGS